VQTRSSAGGRRGGGREETCGRVGLYKRTLQEEMHLGIMFNLDRLLEFDVEGVEKDPTRALEL